MNPKLIKILLTVYGLQAFFMNKYNPFAYSTGEKVFLVGITALIWAAYLLAEFSEEKPNK